MSLYGKPAFIHSDNGPEFTAKAVIKWLSSHRIGPAFIEPGSPWQNGYIESFNGKFLRRVTQQRMVRKQKRGAGDHRIVATPLQSRTIPQHSGIPTALRGFKLATCRLIYNGSLTLGMVLNLGAGHRKEKVVLTSGGGGSFAFFKIKYVNISLGINRLWQFFSPVHYKIYP